MEFPNAAKQKAAESEDDYKKFMAGTGG